MLNGTHSITARRSSRASLLPAARSWRKILPPWRAFLKDYAASVDWVNANTADAAALIGEYSIVDAAVAEKALPYCNIVCLMGANLLEALPGYLEVLYNASPAAVGGEMPDNSFYFA